MSDAHRYAATLTWTGNRGVGTRDYVSYGRDYDVTMAGKPVLQGSAAERFRGDPTRHDPENHFLAAISGCHMLSYLALAARVGVVVVDYRDEVEGVLEFDGVGGGRFTSVTLHPAVTIASDDLGRAQALHDEAHRCCFIAASCRVPISVQPTLHRAGV